MLAGATMAALAQSTGTKIDRVDIKFVGPASVSEEFIRSNLRLKPGASYLPGLTQDDVHSLYGTGQFYNIRVSVDQANDGGVVLTYLVQARPRITEIKIEGNDKISESKLKKKVTVKTGEPLDEQKLFTDVQEMKKLYEKYGLSDTKVKYILNIEEVTGHGTVTFHIEESPKVKITKVEFLGATNFRQKNLRSEIKTQRRWSFSWLTGSGYFQQDDFDGDRDRLADFYRSHGYLDFEIKDVKFDHPTTNSLNLKFYIYEGRQYKVGSVKITGAKIFSEAEIVKGLQGIHDYQHSKAKLGANALPMDTGNIFTPDGLTKDTEAIEDFYGSKGGLFTYRDYGEMIGAIQLTITDYTGEAVHPCETLPWDEVLLIAAWRPDALEMDDRIRAGWFLGDIGIKPDGTADPSHLDRSLSTFSYLWMSGDHTLGYVPGVGTPRGLVAQNDAGVGMVVQAISKSKYWKDTAIFIVEDDSQDGVDHVDGHRNILFVISPYAKRAMPEGTPGYVGKRPYSQASVLRTIELILGLQPMSAFDQYAPPLYDLFQDVDDPSNLTPADLASFDRQAEPPFIDEKAPAKEVAGPLALQLINQTKLLNLDKVDAAGPGLEAVLWLSLTDRPMPDELQRRLDRAPAAGRNAGGRQPEP